MDVSRAILDNLMGRDRNKPTDLITERDHYSNPDVLFDQKKVCKSFLICFCFNTLFPNTTYDQGPCQKRHDTYLKNMFDSDPERAPYQRQYIRECIHWIERRLQEVEKKTKQNQSVIDNKSNFPADRPKQILDRILAIQQDIEKLIVESQKYGQEGKIDDCARCLEEVEKLRDRRKEIQLMGSDMTNAQKQQKICLICGAIQTINDTEKRIQTHLEGKIHQGFLKLRHQVEALKIRLEVLNKLNPQLVKERDEIAEKRRQQQQRRRQENEKKVEKPKQTKETKQPEIQYLFYQSRRNNEARPQKQQRQRSDSASRKRKREKERERSRDKSKQRRQKNDDRERRKDSRDRDRRSRSKDRKERKHQRESKERENKERSHKDGKEHKKKHKKNRSRSREKDGKEEY